MIQGLSTEDLIDTLTDTAEVEGPGTMASLLLEAAERLKDMLPHDEAQCEVMEVSAWGA